MTAEIQQAPEALSLTRKCQLAGGSRSTYYRHLKANAARQVQAAEGLPDPDAPVRKAIHKVAGEMARCGYRRTTRHLRREGLPVNHKKVLRLMREERLLCRVTRRFVRTTDSDHGFPVYPNKARGMALSGPDELWVADLSYVRLPAGFCYVAAVLDAFSRRCIGWAVESYLDARLPLAALEKALSAREVRPGLVHHSERGTQYACVAYVERLQQAGIEVSMSRTGNPYDNAKAESFFKTLKAEEVYLNDYRTVGEARENIGTFLEAVYNQKRLHSALGYLPPPSSRSGTRSNRSNNNKPPHLNSVSHPRGSFQAGNQLCLAQRDRNQHRLLSPLMPLLMGELNELPFSSPPSWDRSLSGFP